ncbi:MAG: hypothetical protein U9O56_09755 [Campylobacterota bacterium]|nr:hypothetical protein [Campylobacterota bacterium]
MYNTPWAYSDEGYYRVEKGKLLYAPVNNTDYSINTKEEIEVEIVTPYQLEQINKILGTSYTIDQINSL